MVLWHSFYYGGSKPMVLFMFKSHVLDYTHSAIQKCDNFELRLPSRAKVKRGRKY